VFRFCVSETATRLTVCDVIYRISFAYVSALTSELIYVSYWKYFKVPTL
jgi:hypothetical protein